MAEGFSPEEKLLRLIRGEKKQTEKPPAPKAEAPSDTQQKPSRSAKARNYFTFVNLGLTAALVIVTILLLSDVISYKVKGPIPAVSERTAAQNKPANSSEESKTAIASTQEAESASRAGTIARQELFAPQGSEARARYDKVPQGGFDKLKDYALKGIVAGENPQVIIEDLKSQKTYFLNKGQEVNNIKVVDILEDRVIVSIDGQEFGLAL